MIFNINSIIIIIKSIFHIIFLFSAYIDIKEKIIAEKTLRIMLLLAILKSILENNINNIYLAVSIFVLPIFLITLFESYINKEIIGLGDIKLLFIIGIYFCDSNIDFVYNFYTKLYIISGIFAIMIKLFSKKNIEYIAFIPYIYIVFLLKDVKII